MRFLAALVLAAAHVMPALGQAATRIMPLGDSITGSPGCWRALLWQQLQAGGLTNIDMVGTLGPQGCGIAHDGDNEGHGGFLAVNIAAQNQLVGWLASTKPDIVIMHLGTNDNWSARSPATLLAAFDKLVDQMRASNPRMKILVAQIIPLNPPTCSDCNPRVIAFNAALPAWAAGKSTANSPITIVDQYTGFNTATDTYDGVHPNSAGDAKIAAKWYPALAAAIRGTTVVSPPIVSTTTSRAVISTPTTRTTSTSSSRLPSPTSSGPAVGAWGQCGGVNWTGSTTCVSGYTCKLSNPYYSQCLPN